ncbi:hypothetical protein CO731_01509 [Aminobacter sp. MSH1]|uniref:hypothetical protein n=1 Tax=Aminobacter sp. MSH1 TaxID=374606 RepID=UPI000D343C26|nr:hypothetical protein [Aminobacter sp. MSH1]AWC22053.1 hypothetical protein CO731_01509 [Aminobacter sp. MSH1]
MAKLQVSDWDVVAANNTDINSIPIDGAVTAPSQLDNIIREVMAQIKTFSTSVTLTVGVSVDNTVPRFDGIAGQLQTSTVTIADTGAMTIASTSAGTLLTAESTDASSAAGPLLDLYRNSASPAVSDFIGQIRFLGKDSLGGQVTYTTFYAQITDPTDGTEDATWNLATMQAGVSAVRFSAGAGLYMTGATDPGVGKINATGLYLNGQSIATDAISGMILAPQNGDYMLVVKCPYGGTVNEVVTKSASGTCTATFKINTTALGGAANAVSSSEQTQAHASANTFVAGDDIVVTISANSSCANMSFTLKTTKAF